MVVEVTTIAPAFFVLPTQIHERYMLFVFSPLALALALRRRLLVPYLALALANSLNLLRARSFVPPLQVALTAWVWAFAIAILTLATFRLLGVFPLQQEKMVSIA